MSASSAVSSVLLSLAALLAGCTAATSPTRDLLPSPGFRRVASQELMANEAMDLYEALARSRPGFLSPWRGSGQMPLAYLDGVRLVDLGSLHNINLAAVIDVTFLSPPEATTRFGTGNSGGAIVIRTR